MIPKFRAWHKSLGMCSVANINFQTGLIELVDNHGSDYGGKLSDIELMQFTGLHDKDGREIYEGDIVKLSTNYLKNVDDKAPLQNYIHTIKFLNGSFILDKGLFFSDSFVEDGIIEVIGNIWQNTDLLSEAKS